MTACPLDASPHASILKDGPLGLLVKWASSFASERQACLRIDDFRSDFSPIRHGLPRGSPVSPILFLLFPEPLFNSSRRLYGYADDVAILSTGTSLDQSAERSGKAATKVAAWCAENGLAIADNKTEVQHFVRTLPRSRPVSALPSVLFRGVPVQANQSTRWLGVYLDTKLSFRPHVETWSARALNVCHHIRRLANTRRGIPAHLLRTAALAAVLPVLLYGAQVWWRGSTRTSARNTQVKTRMGHLVDRIGRVLLALARCIMPVYRTTPKAALLRESGILPPAILLDDLRAKSAIRLRAVDCFHPLASPIASPSPPTALKDKALLCPAFHRPALLPPSYLPARVPVCKKDRPAAAVDEEISRVPHLDITVYSDGSKQADGSTGAGAFVTQGAITLAEIRTPLGTMAEVYDAEVTAALEGLRAAVRSPGAHLATNIFVFLDNQEAASRLLEGEPTKTSQQEILAFRRLASQWPERQRSSCAQPGIVRVIWIPGHGGTPGNDRADKLAGEACRLPYRRNPPLATLAAAQSLLRKTTQDRVTEWWIKEAPTQYVDLGINFERKAPPELKLPRHVLGFLLQCRSGHGDFADYHRRFHHTDADVLCECGQEKSVVHFVFCRAARFRARPARLRPLGSIFDLLGTPKGAKRFHRFVEAAEYLLPPSRRSQVPFGLPAPPE